MFWWLCLVLPVMYIKPGQILQPTVILMGLLHLVAMLYHH